MKLKIREFNIDIDETVLIVVVLSLLFKPIKQYFENYFICYLFIVFHELSHVFVASTFGISTVKLKVSVCGLNIKLSESNKKTVKWLVIFLAGPISNVVLAIIFSKIKIVYMINMALAIINLIPIYPLDGYNIFETILGIIDIKNKDKIKKIIEIMVIIILVYIGIYQFVVLKNLSIILMVFYIFIQSSSLRKYSDSAMYQKCYKNITKF